MTTLLYSQSFCDKNKTVSEDFASEHTNPFDEVAQDGYQTFPSECKLTKEALEMLEYEKRLPAQMFIQHIVSDRYKKVSENIDPAKLKPKRRTKNIKQLMQQSFFHGKNWMGCNFIA